MTISAKIIADSISNGGNRLTTFQLRYPRFIHAEFMTHRKLSRNASSSRAIPVARLIADVERDPVNPSYWGKNQKGMQAHCELSLNEQSIAEIRWDKARTAAIKAAKSLAELNVHKQIVNRLLEPFSHINVLCTATDYANFYALRRHRDAQPEIKVLADVMWGAKENNKPQLLWPGDWHVPYYGKDGVWKAAFPGAKVDEHGNSLKMALETSVACAARVSYFTHQNRTATAEENGELYDRLLHHDPMHASPAEHQGTPDTYAVVGVKSCDKTEGWDHPELHGNFTGWKQYRKLLPNEYVPG